MQKDNNYLLNNDTTASVEQGLINAANIITTTMGGSGQNVLMFNSPELDFTKDGVSVANRIGFKSPLLDAGAKLLVNACDKTVKECGDGTTLTALLTAEFVKQFREELKTVPINDLIEQAETEIAKVIEYTKQNARQVETTSDIYNIALASCKDPKIATLLQNLFKKIGFKGMVDVEYSKHSNTTYIEFSEGLSFDEGFVHQGFANQENGTVIFEEPNILIVEENVTSPDSIKEYLEAAAKVNEPIVIFAKTFSDIVIRYVLTNKHFNFCLVKIPGWGSSVDENVRDIKAFLSTDSKVNKIVIRPDGFTLYNNPVKAKINKRVKQLRNKVVTEDWEVKDVETRIANLNQQSAIIYVGGVTQKNAKEEFDRIEDAVGAIKSSEQGFVKGAGTHLYEYAQLNQDVLPTWFYNLLKEPAYTILRNANVQLEPVFRPYNTRTKQLDDTLVDPANVIISALTNSFALCHLLMNTKIILYDDKTQSL